MWEPKFVKKLLAECFFPVVNLVDLRVVKGKPFASKQEQIHLLIGYDIYFDFFFPFSLRLLWRSVLKKHSGKEPQGLATSGHTTPQSCSPCSKSSSQGVDTFWEDVDDCRLTQERERAKAVIAESIRKLSSEKLQNLWKPHASGVLNMLMEHPQSLKVA